MNEPIKQRTPIVDIEIVTWDNQLLKKTNSLNVIMYNFGQSIDNLSPSFSLTMHLSTPSNAGYLLYRQIQPHDIVIFKIGNKRRFVGMIQDINTNVAVSGTAHKGEIKDHFIVTGIAVTGIMDFTLDLSFHMVAYTENITEAKQRFTTEKFRIEVPVNTPVQTVVTKIIDAWFDVYALMSGLNSKENLGMYKVFKRYIDFASIPRTTVYSIPKVVILPQSKVTLSQFLQQINNHPLYMYYAVMEDAGQYVIHLDKKPFIPENWHNLRRTALRRIDIKSINLHRTMKDAVTVTNVRIPESIGGSTTTQLMQYSGTRADADGKTNSTEKQSTMKVNKEGVKKYGWKLYTVELMYFDHATGEDLTDTILNEAEDLYTMFEHTIDFYSGTITITEDFKDHRIGARIWVEGLWGHRFSDDPDDRRAHVAEFYLESTNHSGGYGITPTNTLKLTRGAIYYHGDTKEIDKDGKSLAHHYKARIYSQNSTVRSNRIRTGL